MTTTTLLFILCSLILMAKCFDRNDRHMTEIDCQVVCGCSIPTTTVQIPTLTTLNVPSTSSMITPIALGVSTTSHVPVSTSGDPVTEPTLIDGCNNNVDATNNNKAVNGEENLSVDLSANSKRNQKKKRKSKRKNNNKIYSKKLQKAKVMLQKNINKREEFTTTNGKRKALNEGKYNKRQLISQ